MNRVGQHKIHYGIKTMPIIGLANICKYYRFICSFVSHCLLVTHALPVINPITSSESHWQFLTTYKVVFLENAGDLCIIILRRSNGTRTQTRPLKHTTHTSLKFLAYVLACISKEKKKNNQTGPRPNN